MNFIILCVLFIIATTTQVSFADEDDNNSYHYRLRRPKKNVKKTCPMNSHWTKCYLGLDCIQTCEKFLTNTLVPDCLVKCDGKSKGGCECNRGFFLNDVGQCVLPNSCHRMRKVKKQICQSTERHVTGAKKFCNELTCKHFWDMEAVFTKPVICKIGSCTCKLGYVRNEYGKCITVDRCPESILYETVTLNNIEYNDDVDGGTYDGGDDDDDDDDDDYYDDDDDDWSNDTHDTFDDHVEDLRNDKNVYYNDLQK